MFKLFRTSSIFAKGSLLIPLCVTVVVAVVFLVVVAAVLVADFVPVLAAVVLATAAVVDFVPVLVVIVAVEDLMLMVELAAEVALFVVALMALLAVLQLVLANATLIQIDNVMDKQDFFTLSSNHALVLDHRHTRFELRQLYTVDAMFGLCIPAFVGFMAIGI